MAMETRLDPKKTVLYFGGSPIAVSTETKIQLKDEYGIEFDKSETESSGWSMPAPQSFSVSVDVPGGITGELRELLYNFIVPYWRANHRGNSLHYINMWSIIKNYLNDDN